MIQVGMDQEAMTRWGFVRYVRMDSLARRRKTQRLFPRMLVKDRWRADPGDCTWHP